jgi:hypothetical protein
VTGLLQSLLLLLAWSWRLLQQLMLAHSVLHLGHLPHMVERLAAAAPFCW